MLMCDRMIKKEVNNKLNNILMILTTMTGISLVTAILMTKSSADALSGLVQGTKANNYFFKNKTKTKDAMLEKFIYLSGVVFMILVLLTNVIK